MTTTNHNLKNTTRTPQRPRDWFERLTGVVESSPEAVREQLQVRGNTLHSTANGKQYICGTLEVPTLAELRERVRQIGPPPGRLKLRQQVADVQSLHRDPDNAGAIFQVASQFNLLEMVGPSVTPEHGVGRYENDHTQGPACAIACGAGTIYRNYFADVNGTPGQTRDRQIDCLSEIGKALGNEDSQLWRMQNGYALPTPDALHRVNARLTAASEAELDELRGLLRIGLHWRTQVTLDGCEHLVSQVYCSALPVSYSGLRPEHWEPFARLILEAAYEATLCAAVLNAGQTGCNRVLLTSLGGGVFGNPLFWIKDAMDRALNLYRNYDLDVRHVSYG